MGFRQVLDMPSLKVDENSLAFDNQGNAIFCNSEGAWYSSTPGIKGSWVQVLPEFCKTVAFNSAGDALVCSNNVWYSATPGIKGSYLNVLTTGEPLISVVFGNTGNALVAGGVGVWYSATPDIEGSWLNVLTIPLPPGDSFFTLTSVAFDNKGHSIVCGGSPPSGTNTGGVWYSASPESEGSWVNVLSVTGIMISVAFDNDGNALAGGIGGLWYSADAGATWTQVGVVSGSILYVVFDTTGNALAVGTSGVFYSATPTVEGSWVLVFTNKGLTSVAFDNDGNAMAGGSGGVWYSATPGIKGSWSNKLTISKQDLIVVIDFDNKGNALAAQSKPFESITNNSTLWYAPAPTPAPIPTSNICFPAGTPVKTDQGILAIEKLDKTIHTLQGLPILHITKTVTLDNYLIAFPPSSLYKNIPSQTTVMSKDHKIEFEGILVPAYRFLEHSHKIKKVKYNGEVLYNVLLEKYGRMQVNGITCETLHPENCMAKLYSHKDKNSIIMQLNDSLQKRDLVNYTHIINRLQHN